MTRGPSAAASRDADVLIVGGGIVGVSTAMQLVARRPGAAVLLLEKEGALAAHQSGHNSGVVHAGVYYAPGSLKADFCRRGSAATYQFARDHGIPAEKRGKLIVATNALEVERLGQLYKRCQANALAPELLTRQGLRSIEPHIDGLAAIRVPSSGITDYPAITRKMASLAEHAGARILTNQRVDRLREDGNGVVAETRSGTYRARHAIVCGGLAADRLARMCGVDVDFRIVPFRGEYFRLRATKDQLVSHLIYPVPNPALPFLGIHLTPMIGGYTTVGPNAVLAMAREGYRRRDVSLSDLLDFVAFRGFWRMLGQHAGSGVAELKSSLWRRGYLELCQRYCPELQMADLERYPSGVRAQAIASDGTLIHDFLIRQSARSLHVCNAPSPAATSALVIGQHLVDSFERAFPAN